MIQDIKPQHLHNEFHMQPPAADDYMLSFGNREIFLNDKEEEIQFVTYEELENVCRQAGCKIPRSIYLFSVDNKAYHLCSLLGLEDKFSGFEYHKMFELRKMKPKTAVFVGTTGYHLYSWYKANQFCGTCGNKTVHDDKERMMRCPECGSMIFPKIIPAVIVGVIRDGKILLTKYAGREYTRYALIAGFTEIGESVEETVAREVYEEVGIHVKNITYYKTQPWGFDSDLLLGYYCEATDSDITLDEKELSTAEWVDYMNVPDDREGLSLTEEMMIKFKECKGKMPKNS